MDYQKKYIKYKTKFLNMKGGISPVNVLTYNVFSGMDEKYSTERMMPTINIILDLNPDIICLQEATTEFIQTLNKDNGYTVFSKSEYLDKDDLEKVEGSGYISILSKFPIKKKKLVYKGGYYDDGILKAILDTKQIFGFDLCVYNVHLSGGTYDKPPEVILTKRIRRMLELDMLNQDLRNSDKFIIMGDFNSDANSVETFPNIPYSFSENELHIFPEIRFYPSRQFDDIVDAWLTIKPNDKGFTEDTEKNSFRKYLKKNKEGVE